MGNNQNKPDFRDLSKGTRFSTKELKEWHKKFMRDFPDEKIDKLQFISLYQKMFSADPKTSKDYCEHIFKRYDTDNNGYIDFKEFMTTLSVASRGTADEKLLWVFKIYDKDNNGYLVEKEIVDILAAIYKSRNLEGAEWRAVAVAKRILRIADDNRDGKISEAEFIRHAQDCPEIKDMLQGL